MQFEEYKEEHSAIIGEFVKEKAPLVLEFAAALVVSTMKSFEEEKVFNWSDWTVWKLTDQQTEIDIFLQNPKKIRKIRGAIDGSVNTQKQYKELQKSLEKDVNEFLSQKEIIPQIEFKSCLDKLTKLFNDKEAWKLQVQSKSKPIQLFVLKDFVSAMMVIFDRISESLLRSYVL